MRDRAIRRVLLFFVAIGAILAAVALASLWNIDREGESSDWVNHTHAVILELKGVMGALDAADGEAASYAVAADPRFRAACRGSLSDLGEHLALAAALTRNEPSQHSQVLRLQSLAEARADVDRDILRAADRDAAAAIIRANAERGSTAGIRSLADALVGQEIALLEARDRASFVQERRVRLTVWAGAAIDMALLLGVARLIAAYARTRRAAARALEEANAVLEPRVRERTADLAAANRRLTEDNIERKWANLALQHQLHYNELIVNSIADLVLVVTKAMNVSRINPAVVRLVGREAEEIINKPLSGVVAIDGDPVGANADPLGPLSRALAEGHELRDTPVLVGDRGGRPVRALLSLYPVRDQDKVVGGVVILRVVQ